MAYDNPIFEIAIYRVSSEVSDQQASKRVRATTEGMLANRTTAISEEERRSANAWARYLKAPYQWQYNEIVGWVRLIWNGPGPVIKGYLWQVGKNSIEGGRARRHYQRGFTPFPFVYGDPLYKVVEEWFDRDASDRDVYTQLRAGLCRITQRSGDLPRRHIDLRVFDEVAPYVRWRDLMGMEAASS